MMTQHAYQLFSASIDDCLEISRLFRDHTEMTDWGGEGFRFPIQQQQFLLQLHRPDTSSYVLKQQGKIVGFGQICQRFGKHHLARLIIVPDARGNRLSYVLIVSLICRAIQQNRKLDFSLFVFRHNSQAIHCYQKLGFIISAQPGPEHQGLYFMQLDNEKAALLLHQDIWQFNIHSQVISCHLLGVSHAHLD